MNLRDNQSPKRISFLRKKGYKVNVALLEIIFCIKDMRLFEEFVRT